MNNNRGVVYTFYSYKGGVGRSMALANVAALLSKQGNRVLVVDWDLEAPGLEKYFLNTSISHSTSSVQSRKNTNGVVDIIKAFTDRDPIPWNTCLLQFKPFDEGVPISLITAGKDAEDYTKNLQSIYWDDLFEVYGFGQYLENLREEWVANFDFVLIDSRTGITDIGGICTIHLPDALVLLFTANEQSVEGITDVMRRARKRAATLPFDRTRLLGVPVPSRFENTTEYKLASKWKNIFAQQFTEIYKDWLPDRTTPTDVLEKLFIPYVPYWSFGEGLPVVEEGTSDPRSIGFAYDLLARLLSCRLQWNNVLKGDVALSNSRTPERINQECEFFFENLSFNEQNTAKNIFLRLIRIAQPNEVDDTQKKIRQHEFDYGEKYVIKKMIDFRLLHESQDSLTKEPAVEISQPELIKDWIRLRAWINENREFLLWRQDMQSKMLEWENSSKDNSLLLSGVALKKAKQLLKFRSEDFNINEVSFIQDSSVKETEARNRNNVNRSITYLGFGSAILSLLSVVFVSYDSRMKENETKRALTIQQDSLSRAIKILYEENKNLLYKLQIDNQMKSRQPLKNDTLKK